MANISYLTGYSLKCWQKVIYVLILKNKEDYRVNWTRPIPVKETYESENAQQLAKKVLTVAENIQFHCSQTIR